MSEGPFASLNLGHATGDDKDRVAENRRRLASAAKLRERQFVWVEQIHGDNFIEVSTDIGEDSISLGDADGLITQKKGIALSIRTADCTPVLLYAPDVQAIAVAHAGWRGAELAIARRGVEELARRYGASSEKTLAVIGPSIRRCCYQVSDDLANRFRARFGEEIVIEKSDGQYLDLAEANRRALIEAGVLAEHVDVLPYCTSCDAANFFSHRRDKGRTGRHLSFAVL